MRIEVHFWFNERGQYFWEMVGGYPVNGPFDSYIEAKGDYTQSLKARLEPTGVGSQLDGLILPSPGAALHSTQPPHSFDRPVTILIDRYGDGAHITETVQTSISRAEFDAAFHGS